jgi:hypothetical protein
MSKKSIHILSNYQQFIFSIQLKCPSQIIKTLQYIPLHKKWQKKKKKKPLKNIKRKIKKGTKTLISPSQPLPLIISSCVYL